MTFVLSFLSSIFALGTVIVPLGIAVFEVNQLKNNYSRISRSEVRNSLQRAQSNFDLTRDGLARLSPVLSAVGLRNHVAQVDNFASLGARGCQVGRQLVELSPSVEAVISGVTEPTSPTYSDTVTYSLAPQLAQMSSDLSQIEAGYKNISPSIKFWLLGNSASFLENIIADSRSLVDGLAGISTNIADIVGIKAQKKYLIVLQNPAEIRATGGFIGSFAVLGFDDGKLVNFKLHDIYDADGQLQSRVAPPDEILHFLGQPNWYMRDANWSPDFPLTARRLEWFLQKETGDKVDGVVSVDVHAATKLLEATGPINLPDFDDTVNHSNFFEKAEFQSEINFFPGSSQKKDYLSAAAMGLMTKLTSGQIQNPLLLVSAISNSLKEKNIFFYFNDPKIQEVMERNNWAGSIRPDFCKNPNSSCLMTVDSNLGANKANFYLSRNFQATGRINKAGDVDIELTVNYQNNSPSRTWPGGDYKNYLRFILPEGSKIDSLTLGDSRQATYSSVLTAKALATVPLNRFLVKQSTESALLELGSLINIPVQSSGSATLKFRLPYQVDLTNSTPDLAISFLKQPGTVSDQFKFTLEYPSFLSPILESSTLDRSSTLVFDQKLVYNSAMDQDKRILVRFLRTNP